MKRCFALMAFVASLALACSEPAAETTSSPPATRPEPIEGPDAPTGEQRDEPTGEELGEFPLARLAAVPSTAPAWVTGVAERCAADDAHACWLLGAVHARGTLGQADGSRARALFARACQGQGGYGCTELAALAEPAAAREHLTRGCDASRADACTALAESLAGEDAAAATTARMRACSIGNADTCVPVPEQYPHDASPAPAGAPTEESRVPASANATVRGIAQRCDRGMAAMCAWLALQYAYDNDFGLEEDPEHALELARRSCNEEATTGCTQVGMLLITHMDSDPDAGREAGTALGRACAAGVGVACSANATVFARFPQLQALTVTSRFEACVLGDTESCEPS